MSGGEMPSTSATLWSDPPGTSTRKMLVEVKTYRNPCRERWWQIGRWSLDRMGGGRWVFMLTGRSVVHWRSRSWYVIVEDA